MAAGKGHKGAKKLLPDAAPPRRTSDAFIRCVEAERKSWSVWYTSTPYYWTWGNSGWYQR